MTADELIVSWAYRDSRYATRRAYGVRHPLGPVEAEEVREHRRREAEALTGHDQGRALRELARWTPPRTTT